MKTIARRAVRKFIPAPPQPFMPADFENVVAAYQAADAVTRRQMSRDLMARLLVDPVLGQYLPHRSSRGRFGHSEIYHHAAIALAYADALPAEAEKMAASLASRSPRAFNHWLWSRACAAQGNIPAALDITNDGLKRFGPDLDLRLERASCLNLLGRTNEANDALAGVAPSNLPDYGYPVGKDIYTDEYVRRMWWQYWAHFIRLSRFQAIDSNVAEMVPAKLRAFLRSHDVQTLIDFGTLCGEVIHRVAADVPGVNVIGVDRQPIIKALNDENYHAENLSFRAGDIFEELRRTHEGPAALTHTRTTCCCDAGLVSNLYLACRENGIRHIVGCEMAGISRETRSFPDFATLQEPVLFRGTMTMHPHRKMLEAAGYRVTAFELIPPTVLFDDPGMHFVYFEAEIS